MLNKELFVERLRSEGFGKTAKQVMQEEGITASQSEADKVPDGYTPKTDRLQK